MSVWPEADEKLRERWGAAKPASPASRCRSRQRRNVRSLIPSNSAASIWLSSDRSERPSTSVKRIRRIPS